MQIEDINHFKRSFLFSWFVANAIGLSLGWVIGEGLGLQVSKVLGWNIGQIVGLVVFEGRFVGQFYRVFVLMMS